MLPPPKLWVFSTDTAAVVTKYGPTSGAIRPRIWPRSIWPRGAVQVRIVTPLITPCAPCSARAMCADDSQRISVPGATSARTPRVFASEPVTVNSAASWPSSPATSVSSSATVGSSPYTSSPTSADVIAASIAADGSVTVSLRRSIMLCAAEALGDQEGQLERLVPVQPRVASGLVPVHQVGRGELLAAAEALGDVVAGQLDVQPARPGADLLVRVEEALHLGHHVLEVAGLVAVLRLVRVPVHRVAHPRHRRAVVADRLQQRRQPVADPARTHPGDEREPALLALRVQPVDQRADVVRCRRRPDLHADRVAQRGEQLDVRAVQLPGALADPEQVPGRPVRRLGAGVDPGQRVLVLQDQRLVAGVEVDGVELLRVGP